jgi:DNA-directed RNA polymerase specialized sigma subunit
MINKNIWTRVMIAVYQGIPIIVKALDGAVGEAVLFKAVANSRTNSEVLFNQIIATTDRNVKLINFKVLTDEAVEILEGREKNIIAARLKGIKFDKISEDLNITIRTIFRDYESAIEKMTSYLANLGHTEEWFNNYFGDDTYLGAMVAKYKAKF